MKVKTNIKNNISGSTQTYLQNLKAEMNRKYLLIVKEISKNLLKLRFKPKKYIICLQYGNNQKLLVNKTFLKKNKGRKREKYMAKTFSD